MSRKACMYLALVAAAGLFAVVLACGGGGGGGQGAGGWPVAVGTAGYDTVYGVSAGPTGSVFAAGYTQGDLYGNTLLGSKDGFLVKFNPAGVRLWTVMINTTGGDTAFGASADPDGNVFVAGETQGDLHGHINIGSNDAFLAKYDTSGAWLWTAMLNTTANDTAYSVAADAQGNVFVGGYTQGGDLHEHKAVGSTDGFVAMYNSSGSRLWTRMINTTGYDLVEDVSVDLGGNVLVAGSSDEDLHGHTNMGSKDAFVAVYNSSGGWLWTAMVNSESNDIAYAAAADSSGNVAVVGYTNGDLDGHTNMGGTDGFVSMFNSSGVWLWTQMINTAGGDVAEGVAIDADGRVFVAGYSNGDLDGHTNIGLNDAFVAVYNSSGLRTGIEMFNSSGHDIAYDVTASPGGGGYLGGYSNGDLGGNANLGYNDGFVARFVP